MRIDGVIASFPVEEASGKKPGVSRDASHCRRTAVLRAAPAILRLSSIPGHFHFAPVLKFPFEHVEN